MGSSLDVAGGRHSVSAQTNTRRLVSEDALRRQRPGQGVLVYRDLPPMRLTLRPWYLDRALRALHDGPKPPKRASSEATVGRSRHLRPAGSWRRLGTREQ